MSDRDEESGSRPIGSHLPKIETLRPPSNSTPTRSPPNSATTGAALPAARGPSSIGQAHTATAAGNSLPAVSGARYSALDRQRELPKDSRTRCEWGTENRTRIAGLISRLLSHFWAANEDSRLRAAIAQDWLSDMGEFHESVVAEACQEWRRAETKRPTIADIRRLCMEASHYRHPDELAPRSANRHDPAAAEALDLRNKARDLSAAESREAWARSHGVASFKEAMEIGLISVSKRPLVTG